MDVEERLERAGLALPPPMQVPAGVEIPFAWARATGARAVLSGHGALSDEGSPAGPFGKVPNTVTLGDAQRSAVSAGLAILASLRREIGDLGRVDHWVVINGFVNAYPGYSQTTAVLNPLSELILDLWGPDAGRHARTAIGVAALPLDLPVVISAEVALRD